MLGRRRKRLEQGRRTAGRVRESCSEVLGMVDGQHKEAEQQHQSGKVRPEWPETVERHSQRQQVAGEQPVIND